MFLNYFKGADHFPQTLFSNPWIFAAWGRNPLILQIQITRSTEISKVSDIKLQWMRKLEFGPANLNKSKIFQYLKYFNHWFVIEVLIFFQVFYLQSIRTSLPVQVIIIIIITIITIIITIIIIKPMRQYFAYGTKLGWEPVKLMRIYSVYGT